MKFFSDCSDCHHCQMYFFGGCIAGHGDDDFYRVTEERVVEMMSKHPVDMRERWKHGMDKELMVLFPAIADDIKTFMGARNVPPTEAKE